MEGENEQDATKGNIPFFFLVNQLGRKRFRELPESEMQALEKRCEMDPEEYEKLLEEYNKSKPSEEQVMVASHHGSISRVMVDSVPVVNKVAGTRGVRIVKVTRRNDSLSSISLLGALDEIDEAAADAAELVAPAPVDAVPAEAEADDMEDEAEEPSQTNAKLVSGKAGADITLSSINSVPRPSIAGVK